ncbi:alpha/beta hydrolase family protein [Jiangella mangrovi]|uniref:Putative dienelactone hydrolase n=1 Tax=Jiangella mangrovi TaxID=1524084 RepID=A0A7W9GVB2_9ACTN|nr:alpha/beta fold hydrolase [Jiangella mangrovi]MBB5790396.1 putative dienelactone hydrolase [Jiangella mangrovi]
MKESSLPADYVDGSAGMSRRHVLSAGMGLAAVGAVAAVGASVAEAAVGADRVDAGRFDDPSRIISAGPITLSARGRPAPLEVRVTAPATGRRLPVILFAHGHGQVNFLNSYLGYGPIVDFLSSHGFVVIQPTFLDATALGLRDADDPDAPLYARARAEDMSRVLDQLDVIERAVPHLAGRLARDKIAAVGHSLGGHTAALLLGMQYDDPSQGGRKVSLADRRIRAGVVIAGPGRGGDALRDGVAELYPALNAPDFSTMRTPALVVAGDRDLSTAFTDLGASWRMDAYFLAPAPKSLLTVFDGEHQLGGICGYDSVLTTDENPQRVAAVGRLTSAYLRTAFNRTDPAWQQARDALTTGANAIGQVDSK